MQMRFILSLTMVISSLAAIAEAQQPDLSKLSDADLVARLASKNVKPPELGFSKSTPDPPPGYSRRKQDDVYAAVQELQRRDERCLDELIGALGDQRYCASEDYYGEGFLRVHVGQMCYNVLQDKLEPKIGINYDPALPSYFRSVVRKKGSDAQQWLQQRRGKNLADLQKEACEWFLDQPQPHDVETDSWDKVHAAVRVRLEQVKSTGKPYEPKPYKPRERW